MGDLYLNAEEWVNAGDSAVVAPGGKFVAGPLRNEAGVLYADVNSKALTTRGGTHVTGHYQGRTSSLCVPHRRAEPAGFTSA
jgi:nitrilase